MGVFTRNLELNGFVENTKPLQNPYKGMYCIHKFYVDEKIDLEKLKLYDNQKLILVELNISAYNTGSIDEAGLENIRALFNKYKELNINIILRFLYDFDGYGIKNEPDSISIIKEHMEQLDKVIKEFEALIFVVQGLFIGSWGEMHGTRYHEKHQHVALYNSLVKNSQADVYYAVRCPYMWRYITGRDSKDVSGEERLGLFNDAILGSETDLGTYLENGHYSHDGKRIREQEIAFQNKLCRLVPNGGEVLYSDLSTDNVQLLKTLDDMNVSYLNSEHDGRIIEHWKREKAYFVNPSWKDKSFYDYLAEYVGYRFNLFHMSGKYYKPGRKLKFNIKLSNVGTAPCYQRITVKLVLLGKEDKYQFIVGRLDRAATAEMLSLGGVVTIPKAFFRKNKNIEVALILTMEDGKEKIVLGNIRDIRDRTNIVGKI